MNGGPHGERNVSVTSSSTTLMACRNDYRYVANPRRRERIILCLATVPLSAIGNPSDRHHAQDGGGGADVIA
jgi:hypothetical protein